MGKKQCTDVEEDSANIPEDIDVEVQSLRYTVRSDISKERPDKNGSTPIVHRILQPTLIQTVLLRDLLRSLKVMVNHSV